MSPREAVSPGHACVGAGAARGAVSGAERSERSERLERRAAKRRALADGILYCSSHWWFTISYNIQVFQNVSRCFLPTHHENYTSCPDKPLIISGWWYSAEVVSGGTSGEVSDVAMGSTAAPRSSEFHRSVSKDLRVVSWGTVVRLTLLGRPSGRHRL
jgi:hypothetical protein